MDTLQANLWWHVLGLCPQNATTLDTWLASNQATLSCAGSHFALSKNNRHSPLSAACERGNLAACIRHFHDPTRPLAALEDGEACIALVTAAHHGHPELVGWLVHAGLHDPHSDHDVAVLLGLDPTQWPQSHSSTCRGLAGRPSSAACKRAALKTPTGRDMLANCMQALHQAATHGHVLVCDFFSFLDLTPSDLKFYSRCGMRTQIVAHTANNKCV